MYDISIIVADDNINNMKNILDNLENKYLIEVIIISNNKQIDYSYKYSIKHFNVTENMSKYHMINRGFSIASGKIILIYNNMTICNNTINNIIDNTINNLTQKSFFIFSDGNNNHFYAIHKFNLELIACFDKRFIGDYYCEKEFLLKIEHVLKLDIVINKCNTSISTNTFLSNDGNDNDKLLYEQIKFVHENNKFNYPKILFLYWDLSPMSYLNFLTIESFNKYNEEWKIIIYVPKKRYDIMTWNSGEQKERYVGKCYFYKLYDICNVSIIEIDMDDIGFSNNVSEVHKSDYLRYYMLYKHGGVWSDFDILYVSQITDKIICSNESISFYMINNNLKYYPIGFLICKRNSVYYKLLVDNCNKKFNKNNYQCIGATLVNKINKDIENNLAPYDVAYHSASCYLPWEWKDIYCVYKYSNCNIKQNTIGIHWFNGAPESKNFINELDKRLLDFKITCYIDKYIAEYVNNI